MIGTFLCSLLIILIASIMFFYMFLDQTLNVSVLSIFYAHTHSIVQDIIQIKRNDFILVQNELKSSGSIILDIIEGKNFNKYSLYQDVDPNDSSVYDKEKTMSRIRKYLRNTQILIKESQEASGTFPKKQYVNWHLDTDFSKADDEKLEE